MSLNSLWPPSMCACWHIIPWTVGLGLYHIPEEVVHRFLIYIFHVTFVLWLHEKYYLFNFMVSRNLISRVTVWLNFSSKDSFNKISLVKSKTALWHPLVCHYPVPCVWRVIFSWCRKDSKCHCDNFYSQILYSPSQLFLCFKFLQVFSCSHKKIWIKGIDINWNILIKVFWILSQQMCVSVLMLLRNKNSGQGVFQ